MIRLYIPSPRFSIKPGTTIALTSEEHHYLYDVLRVRSQQRIEIFDGCGEAVIAQFDEISRLSLTVIERKPPHIHQEQEIVLVQGLLKGDKFEWVIQKATELGVHRIIPVLCHRSISRPSRAHDKQARWQKIAQAAAQQSGRLHIPQIDTIQNFRDFLASSPQGNKLFFWESVRGEFISSHSLEKKNTTWLCIGPEGGFTQEEASLAQAAGFEISGLGPHILRAETAALAAVTLTMYLLNTD